MHCTVYVEDESIHIRAPPFGRICGANSDPRWFFSSLGHTPRPFAQNLPPPEQTAILGSQCIGLIEAVESAGEFDHVAQPDPDKLAHVLERVFRPVDRVLGGVHAVPDITPSQCIC